MMSSIMVDVVSNGRNSKLAGSRQSLFMAHHLVKQFLYTRAYSHQRLFFKSIWIFKEKHKSVNYELGSIRSISLVPGTINPLYPSHISLECLKAQRK